jgi:hypothetical protein
MRSLGAPETPNYWKSFKFFNKNEAAMFKKQAVLPQFLNSPLLCQTNKDIGTIFD